MSFQLSFDRKQLTIRVLRYGLQSNPTRWSRTYTKHPRSGVLYMRAHQDSNLTDSVSQLAILFRCTHNLAQSGFESCVTDCKAILRGGPEHIQNTLGRVFCICGPTRTRTWEIGFGDRQFTTSLWTHYYAL
jgi:hypothetical protein